MTVGDAATLALAYGLAAAAVGAYVLHLARRAAALRRELEALEGGGGEERPK